MLHWKDLTIPVQILHPTQAKIQFFNPRACLTVKCLWVPRWGNGEVSTHYNTRHLRISAGVTRSTSQLLSNFAFGKLSASLNRSNLVLRTTTCKSIEIVDYPLRKLSYIYIYVPNRKMTTDSYAVTNHVEVWRWPIPHRSLVSHVIPRGQIMANP